MRNRNNFPTASFVAKADIAMAFGIVAAANVETLAKLLEMLFR